MGNGSGMGTYVARIQDGGILQANLREDVALVEEKTVHIPDEP